MTTSSERLWYACTVCGAAHSIPWDLGPQARERRLTCCDGGDHKQTLHRLAGLGPISRKDDCPAWCTDHRTWRDGTEEHLRVLVTWQGWHGYLQRWDYTALEIKQLEDRPDLQRKDEALPHINCLLSIASPQESRIAHALLGQALAILDAERSPAPRPAHAADRIEVGR